MQQHGWTRKYRVEFERGFYDFLGEARVNSRDYGEIVLGDHLYRAQKTFFTAVFDGLEQDIHKFDALKSRQLGISTSTRALTLFWLGMHDGLLGACVFDTDQNKQNARREIETIIRALPPSLGFPGIKSTNRIGLVLDNNSGILFYAAGVKKTKGSGTLGRSVGLSMYHASELCSYDNDEGWQAFEESCSEIHPNRLYIRESTARGFNSWNDLWEEDRADTAHVGCVFLGWWSKDSQVIERNHPDFERYGLQPPTDLEIKKIEQVRSQYDWQITPEQLAWIRRKTDPNAHDQGDQAAEYEPDVIKLQEQPWCVTRETRVGTARGILKISDIRQGDVTTRGLALKAGQTGRSVIWRCKTKLGYVLRGTPNHPLIDMDGNEVRLDSSVGVRVKLQPPRFSTELYRMVWREGPFDLSALITPELARFVGLFMGDGSASNGRNSKGPYREVSIVCDKQDMDVADECARLFRSLFSVEPSINMQKEGRNWVSVRSGAASVFETIKKLGLLRNDCVNTQRRVHVPEFIWRSPKHVVREFLRGLFEADGFNAYETNRVALFSKHQDFIADIQRLLLGFGLTSRSTSALKRSGDHTYTGNQLELRTAEAVKFNEDIGFLSARKIARASKPPPPLKRGWAKRGRPQIVLEDEIVEVVNENVVEDVFNLTVEGDHLFDANGILTHNTEEDAFQMTGAVFFHPEKLTEQVNTNVSKAFKTYMFAPGIEYTDLRVYKAPNARSIELKVWEEPQEDCVYVIAADPAYGSNENNDRSAIQVLRCYADGCDQVAEYAWPLISTRSFAWTILAIASWYASAGGSDVYLIVELNGPGNAVWDEIDSTKRHVMSGYQPREMQERGLPNIFVNVRNYLYSRPDSLASGKALMWKTSPGGGPAGKVRVMERLRDFTDNGMLKIRSMATLEEMRSVTREGDTIAAQGKKKDDRVMALGLGIRCWEERVRRAMSAQQRTRTRELARNRLTPDDKYKMFTSFQFQKFLGEKKLIRTREQRALQIAQRRFQQGRHRFGR